MKLINKEKIQEIKKNSLRHYTQYRRWNSKTEKWEYRKFYWDSAIKPSEKLKCSYKGHWEVVR